MSSVYSKHQGLGFDEDSALISIILRQHNNTSYIASLSYLKDHTHFIFICFHKFFHSHVGPESMGKKVIFTNGISHILQMTNILKQYRKLKNISLLVNNNHLFLNISIFQGKIW